MEVTVQGHNTDGLLLARCWHYRLRAHTAARSELLVKVLDAVDVVGSIHSERDAVQTAVAHHASEAVRVVGFPCGSQDALHDGLTADGAGLQGVNVARLAVGLLFYSIEGLATQLGAAGHADKAVNMEDLVHGSAAGAFTHYVLSTVGTASKIFLRWRVVHVKQHLLGQALQLIFRVCHGSPTLWWNSWSSIGSQAWWYICDVGLLGAWRLVCLGGCRVRSPGAEATYLVYS